MLLIRDLEGEDQPCGRALKMAATPAAGPAISTTCPSSLTASPSFARHGGTPPPGDALDLILLDVRHHCAKGIDDDVVLVLVEESSCRVADAVRG